MPWFDGDVAKVWLEVAADQWTPRSMAMHDVGQVGVTTLGPSTTYIRGASDFYDICDDLWGQPPAEGILGEGDQYVYDNHIFSPPNSVAHRIDPSARCVAYPEVVPSPYFPWGSQWSLHDLENNEFFVLPSWGQGRFYWFSE